MQVKVGLVQSRPVFLNLEATMRKMETAVPELATEGCQLILFPESVLPGYPRGFDFGAVVGRRTPAGRRLWQAYWDQSVDVPGPITDQLADWAKRYQLFLAVGVTERDKVNASLYCSLLYFSPKGYAGKHRKLKPTGTERLIWGEGQADSLITMDTPLGRIGGLICWENYMPLARFALYQQGIDIYLAPTADAREGWLSSMRHIALEGRCFVLSCNQYARKSDYPPELAALADTMEDDFCRGGSVICSPMGEVLAGPLWDEEGTLSAVLDLEVVVRSRYDFSVAGHYHRPGLFQFSTPGQPPQLDLTNSEAN